MDATQKTEDEVCTALHDCDNDANRAVNYLLEGSCKVCNSVIHISEIGIELLICRLFVEISRSNKSGQTYHHNHDTIWLNLHFS